MKNPFIFLLAALALTYSVNGQDKWSLNRCIEHARENNIDIRRGLNSVKNADLNELQSKLAFHYTQYEWRRYYWNFGLTIDPISNTRQPGSRQTLSTTASGNWTHFIRR